MNAIKQVIVMAVALVVLDISAVAQMNLDASRRTAIVQAVEKASPAVVTVTVTEIRRQRVLDPFSNDFFGLFGFPGGSPRFRERKSESMGSGFFFDNEGHVLTNYHVVANASVIRVTLPDGRTLDVELVGGDETTDVAVLRARGKNLPYVALGDSDRLMIGEWAIAIGNPFGMLMNDPQPSVSVGVISANHRRVQPNVGGDERLYWDMIQTDAAINPGNSGGPLVNAQGEVIGINTFIFSSTGGSIGLGFAIPIDRVKRVADEIIQYGRRRNPWAGFKVENVQSLQPGFVRELGITADHGCVVVNILQKSPAFQAGLEVGDVITSINDQSVQSASDIDYAIWGSFVDDSVVLEVERSGRHVTVRFKIVELAR